MAGEMNEELQNLIDRFGRAPDSRLFAPLADAYRKSGDIDKAIEICERGLEKYPDYASAHIILGKCFYDKGATQRAQDEFMNVLDHDPENMVAIKFMGEISLAENKQEEAVDYFKRLLAIDPMNEEASRILKEMESDFRVKEIDLENKKTVRDERPRDLATITLAGIYTAQGYYNKALRIYQDILHREPSNREAQEMVEKLQSMMDSSERERDSVFEEDVLTISVDDVSEEVAASTAGPGGGAAEEVSDETAHGFEGREDEEEEDVVKEVERLTRVDKNLSVREEPEIGEVISQEEEEIGETEEQVSKRGQRAERRKSVQETTKEQPSQENIDSFEAWLRKLKDQ
jgi:tetratricopeptide (TPR) repeat protein